MSVGPILHLLPRAGWDAFLASSEPAYTPASLAAEGFVHCTSGDDVLLRVANAFYRSEPGEMVALTVDPALLTAEVRWEPPAHDDPLATERFPHVYGPLGRGAVVGVRRLERDAAGAYTGFGTST